MANRIDTCPFDGRPAMRDWRDHWREPLCEKCSACLIRTMYSVGSRTVLDEIEGKSRTSQRETEAN